MGFTDNWDNCMGDMGMPTPTEAWDDVKEALEKLHEIDVSLGGLGLFEAAEQLGQMGVSIEVAPEAGAVAVSWWVGNAVGCVITAAFRQQLTDALEWLVGGPLWPWAQLKVNEVQYPVPDLSDVVKSQEETSIRSSSTAQDDAPPPPIIDQGSGDAATVRYLQTLLVERFGYQIAIDGDFGPATAAAVQSFKQSNNLGGNTEVDEDTWRALQTADAQSS